MEWISVKDRLPEVEEDVLMYLSSIGVSLGFINMMGFWVNEFGGSTFIPTHWTPIPQLPEET